MASQTRVLEPVAIAPIPAQLERLSRSQRAALRERVVALSKELVPWVRLVTLARGVSPLDRLFARLARKERFALPLEGIERLSTGLRLPGPQQWRRDGPLRDALYVLMRLRAAKTIAEDLAAVRLDAPLAFVLTVFRREGGFAVPLGLDELQLGAVPPPLPAPQWSITQHFLGPHHAFHLEKEAPPWLRYGPLIRGVRERIDSRAGLLRLLQDARHAPGEALLWLRAAKQAAFTLYLFVLGGLDYMTTGVSWPGADDFADQRLLFRYVYARNRAAIRPDWFLSDLLSEGVRLFDDVCTVTPAALRDGSRVDHALALLVQGEGEAQQHYVLPNRAQAVATLFVREAVVALLSMRSIPLWCGGKAFEPALPPAVAYMRYNGGDVNFVVMVLNLLDRILDGPALPGPRLARGPAARLEKGLAEFRRSRNKAVWTVLDTWKEDTEATSFLKSEPVRKGFLWRAALLADAKGTLTSLPGAAESRFRGELNGRGDMASALPLLEAMTDRNLWPAFAEVMTLPIGVGRKPWLGHAPNRIGNQIGLNVLRFHYTLRGYEEAFRRRNPG